MSEAGWRSSIPRGRCRGALWARPCQMRMPSRARKRSFQFARPTPFRAGASASGSLQLRTSLARPGGFRWSRWSAHGRQNCFCQVVLFDIAPIGAGGDVEAGWHGQAGRHHARQRCTLAAHPLEGCLGAIQIENVWTGLRRGHLWFRSFPKPLRNRSPALDSGTVHHGLTSAP